MVLPGSTVHAFQQQQYVVAGGVSLLDLDCTGDPFHWACLRVLLLRAIPERSQGQIEGKRFNFLR